MIQFEKLGVVLQPCDAYHAKFNTGAIRQGGVVHLLYRWAQTKELSNGIGPLYVQNFIAYAQMTPDGKLLRDDDQPVFERTHQWEKRGLEDPRMFSLDGQNYVTYTAWDGKQARVAFAKANADFSKIQKFGIVPAKRFDKDAFFFPERIRGKIAYVHRFEPNIQIDYFDELEDLFDEDYWAQYEPDGGGSVALASEQPWEAMKVGGSVPPIRTKNGWLFVYHGVGKDRIPSCYRAGLALMDFENPHKILARLPYPVLEPTEPYEMRGDVNHVVFPCGGYEYEGYLYLVYGGADKVTALARCPMEAILAELDAYRVKG